MGVLIVILAHGFCSRALFCLSNYLYERYYTRNLFLLKGIAIIFPSINLFWFIFLVFNIGAPPSLNFFREIILIGAIIKWSYLFIILLIIYSFFRSIYSLYLYSYIIHGKTVFLFGVKLIDLRSFDICLYHIIPLVIFLFKVNVFFYLNSLIKILNCGFNDVIFTLNNLLFN